MLKQYSRTAAFCLSLGIATIIPCRAQNAPTSILIPEKPVPYSNQLDADMLQVLELYSAIAGTPIYQLPPPDARQQFAAEDAAKALARISGKQEAPQPVGMVIDQQQIPGPGGQIPIRIYVPSGDGPFPVVVYFHGGGYVIATIDTYDASPRALADYSQAIIVSVEYRKAPEHKFPAAVQDAYASYQWVLANAQTFNGDPTRVAVAGESAGGALATDVCIMARNNGIKMPLSQLLIYPYASLSPNFPSATEYANAIPLGKAALPYFAQNYLSQTSQSADPEASPLLANLNGLPPATIIAAQVDPLQSEGKEYAQRLTSAGVYVDYTLYSGVTHEFFGMGAVVAKAKTAEMHAADQLRQSFNK